MNHQQDLLSGANGIPLHCNVCPRKPDFSDVSHLLTHIASKGHLSNYYKMKVQAGSDRNARHTTDEYDRWYADYNVQDLMGERMKQKERRKGSGGVTVASRRGPRAPPHTARSQPAPPRYTDNRTQRMRENTLDPQLGPRIKLEDESRSGTPLSAYSIDPAALNRQYVPSMQSWSATPYGNSPMTQDHSVFDSLCSTPSDDSTEYAPRGRRQPRRSARNLSNSNICDMVGEDEMEYDDGLNESTKLKGVYWNGMGIFDSATADMRRKRNQKKATSVIQSLKATSEIVEPNELVFDDAGELVREREITGNPNEDDGGLLQGESEPEPDTPPKKKTQKAKRSRPRTALLDRHVNTGRVLRRRDSHHPGHNTGYRGGPYYDGQDEDDELTYGRTRPRQRTGLSIHRDNSGPEITFDNPASMRTLNSSFHPQQSSGLHGQYTHQHGYSNDNRAPRTHQRVPSLPFGGGPGFRPANPPNFGSFGQINNYSMFQSNPLGQNPFGMVNGNQAIAAFQQQQYGQVQPTQFGNEGMFHPQTQMPVQAQAA